ncbi:hypothetical protein ACPUVO_07010 [Pseudocolwellia sp. HL-MZ19]|uniref:hypothetical protein n=1 Tax=unclassified Pseudocolwellia TaxID=2848178 RepID=UPI003CF8DCD3
MKIFQSNLGKLFTISLVLIPGIALADFKSDIIESCTNYQKDIDKSEINACKLYIDGFIDSSLLSENAVVKPKAMIGNDETQQSEFLQRAYRTRVLSLPTSLATEANYQFCIPLEYDRKIVASTVAKSLDIASLEDKALKVVLSESLISNFPCD